MKHMDLAKLLPPRWQSVLQDALRTDSFRQLETFLEREYGSQEVFPPPDDLFSAGAVPSADGGTRAQQRMQMECFITSEFGILH